jgi:hypothetical protein
MSRNKDEAMITTVETTYKDCMVSTVVIIASSLFLDIQTCYVVSTVVIIASFLFLDIQTFYAVSTVVIIASSLFLKMMQ